MTDHARQIQIFKAALAEVGITPDVFESPGEEWGWGWYSSANYDETAHLRASALALIATNDPIPMLCRNHSSFGECRKVWPTALIRGMTCDDEPVFGAGYAASS